MNTNLMKIVGIPFKIIKKIGPVTPCDYFLKS